MNREKTICFVTILVSLTLSLVMVALQGVKTSSGFIDDVTIICR